MGFATVSAVVGLGISAATTAASFAQAAEQAEKKQKAENAAAKAMAEAKKRLAINVYEELAIQKEAYEAARRNALAQGATATETLREGDPRALAAGVGRVQLAQQMGQEKISLAQQQEQSDLDRLVAAEEGRLLDIGTSMDLMEVQGAQLAARDAEEAEARAISQGIAGIGEMGDQAQQMFKLYDDSDLTPAQLEEKRTGKEKQRMSNLQSRLNKSTNDKKDLRIMKQMDRIKQNRRNRGVSGGFSYMDDYNPNFFDIRQSPYYMEEWDQPGMDYPTGGYGFDPTV